MHPTSRGKFHDQVHFKRCDGRKFDQSLQTNHRVLGGPVTTKGVTLRDQPPCGAGHIGGVAPLQEGQSRITRGFHGVGRAPMQTFLARDGPSTSTAHKQRQREAAGEFQGVGNNGQRRGIGDVAQLTSQMADGSVSLAPDAGFHQGDGNVGGQSCVALQPAPAIPGGAESQRVQRNRCRAGVKESS